MLSLKVYETVKTDVAYVQDKTVSQIQANDRILEYLKHKPSITNHKAQELCGYTKDQAYRILRKLVDVYKRQVMGPLAGWVIKQFDKKVEGHIPAGFEMLINNFSIDVYKRQDDHGIHQDVGEVDLVDAAQQVDDHSTGSGLAGGVVLAERCV